MHFPKLLSKLRKSKKNVDEWVFYVIILDVLKNTQTVVLCTITQLEGG